jgi:oligo-1,6-glucosidase
MADMERLFCEAKKRDMGIIMDLALPNSHNPQIIEETKRVTRFWLDKGAAGFRCDAFDSYGDDTSRPFYRVSKMIPKRFSARELLKRLTTRQQGLEWNAVYLENHDQPRIVSRYGAGGPGHSNHGADEWMLSAKMLGLMEMTLKGTPFIYQGQEIGMTNFDYTRIEDLNDVESRNRDARMKRWGIPRFLRWRWIKASSRDNARTPMQWNTSKNAGFTSPEAKPWLPVNHNYTLISYEGQRKYPGSILNFYRQLIKLRAKSECLRSGDFTPVFADAHVMIYLRTQPPSAADSASTGDAYTVLLNFSGKTRRLPATLSFPSPLRVVFSNTGRNIVSGFLLPWEGMLLWGEVGTAQRNAI